MLLYLELAGLGFSGSYQQLQRFLKPYRAKRKWSELATVRFETAPGEQAQVNYGQLPALRLVGGTQRMAGAVEHRDR